MRGGGLGRCGWTDWLLEPPATPVGDDRVAQLTFLDARPPALGTAVLQKSALLNTLLAGSIINQELATQQCFASHLDQIIGL